MVSLTIGNKFKYFVWVIYILFLYSLMASYSSGGIVIIKYIFNLFFLLDNKLLFSLFFFFPFIIAIILGVKFINYLNNFLIFFLIFFYFFLFYKIFNKSEFLFESFNFNKKFIFFSIPLMVTSFGFHLIIPTLKSFLNSNIIKLKLSIFFGGFMSFIIYISWEFIILGIIPVNGDNGLLQIFKNLNNPVEDLIYILSKIDHNITFLVMFFSFFALTSSFIGVSVGVYDFWADGLSISKFKFLNKLILILLTFFFPFLFSFFFPGGFLFALNYASIFAAFLLIILPALMVWYGRYIKKLKSNYKSYCKKLCLFITILFGFCIIFLEILNQFNFFYI